MANVYKTKIDIKNTRPDFKPTFVQFDAARLEIELTDDGQTYDLSNIDRVEFTHVRPDKAVIIQAGEIVTDGNSNIIHYTYRGSEMDALGTVKTSLAIFDTGNKKVSSHSFDVAIVKDLRDEIFEPAQPHFGKLQTLIDDVEHLKEHGGGGEVGTGPQGEKGDPFTYADFTPEQLESLRGEKGDPFIYEDFTPDQLESLRGPEGPAGTNANVTNASVLSAIGYTPANSVDVGNVAQLETTNKTIVNAINEVKQYANDGKSSIVAAVVGKGGTATINDTFSSLAGAISSIPTGKKFRAQTFVETRTLNVTSLDFKPSIVLVRGIDSTYNRYLFKMYVDMATEPNLTKDFNEVVITVERLSQDNFKLDIFYDFDSFVVRSNGFSVTAPTFNVGGFWVAIE